MDKINFACQKCGHQQLLKVDEVFRESIRQELMDDIQRRSTEERIVQDKKIENFVEENQELKQKLEKIIDQKIKSDQDRDLARLKAKEELVESKTEIEREAVKKAEEMFRPQLEQKEQKITELEKDAQAMQRKATQVTGRLQGEALELSLEDRLRNKFRNDLVRGVPAGTRGADIEHIVRDSRGFDCGTILWELKQTKNWQSSWVTKLKDDLMAAKADVPAIVSAALPNDHFSGIVLHEGVWVAKPGSAIILASLLRERLLAVRRTNIINKNRETNAESLYNYVTSPQFAQQVSSLIETVMRMKADITKERSASERIFSKREAYTDKIVKNVANVVGNVEGVVGDNSMSKIEGLDVGSHSTDNEEPPDEIESEWQKLGFTD